MRTSAKSQTNHRWWLALLVPVFIGAFFYLFSLPAQAGGDKGVPTKQEPVPAPKAEPAKLPATNQPTPPKATKLPSGGGLTMNCRWMEVSVPEVGKTEGEKRHILVSGHVVDPYCGPTITLPGYLVTVPISNQIEVGNKTFVCGPTN